MHPFAINVQFTFIPRLIGPTGIVDNIVFKISRHSKVYLMYETDFNPFSDPDTT